MTGISGFINLSGENMLKVGVNGFGRIGRNFLRAYHRLPIERKAEA